MLAGNADFRRLWLGQVISEIGDWFNNIAVLALCLELAGANGQGAAMAFYATARHLPLLLFNPSAGVIADRLNRKRIMIAADLLRAVLALGFLLALRWRSLAVVYASGVLLYATSTFFNTAKKAAIPNIVRDKRELLSANALSASTTAATIAIGSGLGGLIASFLGRGTVFIINAITFLISAELIRRIHAVTNQRGATKFEMTYHKSFPAIHRLLPFVFKRLFIDFRQGLAYVGRRKILWAIFVVAGGWGLGNGVARALYSIFGAQLGAREFAGSVAHPTDFGISVLFVAMGLGGVLGAPLARRFNATAGAQLGKRMGRSLIFDGCGLALFSLMPNLWSAALLLVIREMNFAVWWTAQQTILMTESADDYRGRVFASYETAMTLMMLASILAAGFAADRYGIRAVAFAGGFAIILSGVTWFVLQRDDKEQSLS